MVALMVAELNQSDCPIGQPKMISVRILRKQLTPLATHPQIIDECMVPLFQ